MGYQITYQPIKKLRYLDQQRSCRTALTGLFFLLFLLFTHLFWPDGRELLQSILIPGDAAVTVAAMESFSHDLRTGLSLSECFTGFCRTVLEGAVIAAG